MKKTLTLSVVCVLTLLTSTISAKDYHVSKKGDDSNSGNQSAPFKTISAAAEEAMPGDTITVHEGVYRERINPPRGGVSDEKRIAYQAADGEKVVIKGSEVINGWQKVQGDTWKVTIPNSFFGEFNPYSDLIRGDWFTNKGRDHHTGAVYQNGHWLIEAANLEDVLKPIGAAAGSYGSTSQQYLLNVAWLRAGEGSGENGKIPAAGFAAQHGIQTADCSEGGKCIGWIERGDWVSYEKVDFGQRTEQIEIRAASPAGGGVIELRLDKPDGELIGTCTVKDTGDWQSWSSFKTKIKPTSGVKTLCLVFRGPKSEDVPSNQLWFAEVDSSNTTIWAQFSDVNPNESQVEINVRQTVFYPKKTGINYLTIHGFTMEHAATPWAPPTAEQIGLIGTNWSKGWIIEDNVIRYSTCVGVALGKHGDKFDNTSANSAEGYVKTIERALEQGWSKENIGHHIVRDNYISHCEQAGIVGSLGAIFSKVSGNHIFDIWTRRLFTGHEMAGIKFHAPIDTLIQNNCIHNAGRGIWLDWMTQGTRVTQNLLFNNSTDDLYVEVNHGPFLVDNNIFLSPNSLLDMSQGGAYTHNLFADRIRLRPVLNRDTPFHPAHRTEMAGLANTKGGDNRFYNNIFVNGGLAIYDKAKLSMFMAGNVFLNGAKPSKYEQSPLVQPDFNPSLKLIEKDDGVYLQVKTQAYKTLKTKLVTTELLGRAAIPNLPYEKPDGSPLTIDTDYLGNKRNASNPSAGPFENLEVGDITLKVWCPGPQNVQAPEPFLPVPTQCQMDWHKAEYRMFVHFGMKTFYPSDNHMGNGKEDPKKFNPVHFNADQWVETAKAGGFEGLVLTLKHHEGFCIWQTDTTDFSVKSSSWKNGKGDILKEVIEACRKGDISVGVYMSLIDKHFDLAGSPKHANYGEFYYDQLKEISTRYGHIDEYWFDGFQADRLKMDYKKMTDLLGEAQPHAVIYDSGTMVKYLPERCLAWEGAHGGANTNQNYRKEINGKLRWYPNEPSLILQGNWFHNGKAITSLERIQNYYLTTVGYGITPLMNVSPNQDGLFDEESIERLKEFKTWVDRLHSNDLTRAEGVQITSDSTRGKAAKYGPENTVDGKYDTYYATDDDVRDAVIEFNLSKVQEVDGFILQEYIPLGQRVDGYSIECFVDGKWNEVFSGKKIGYKRIVLEGRASAKDKRFPATDRVRLKITNAFACPLINSFEVIGSMNKESILK